MPDFLPVQALAPAGSTGNQTTAPIPLSPDAENASVEFVVEAIGATPTVTWKAQVSDDGVKWFDAQYVTDSSDTVVQTALTATAVGTQIIFLRLKDRDWRLVQLVVSANTNVTFRAELRQADRD
jgi:hypothetical protein